MKKFYLLLLSSIISLTTYCQNETKTTILIYFRMATSPWEVTTSDFDILAQNPKYSRSVTLDSEPKLSDFISKLNNLEDTVLSKELNSERTTQKSNGQQITVSTYPQIDTMGKIIITNPDCTEVFYYSLNVLWNSLEDKAYKINDKFRKYILDFFFINGLPRN